MARTNVTPGVYTSETDLTIMSKSIGVTSAALIGETLKGPAFQPIRVSSYGEFKAYFGGLNPTLAKSSAEEKYAQYELAYVAKEYLSEANSLYVTRVLGLSGYDAGDAYIVSITINDSNNVRNIPVMVLRSNAQYTTDGLKFKATKVEMELCGDEIYSDLKFSVILQNSTEVAYYVSLDPSKKNYAPKVLGGVNNSNNGPAIYVDEIYDNVVKNLITSGKQISIGPLTSVKAKMADYQTEYKSATTPWILSEIKDSKAIKLFKLITISDGASANTEVKFSIENINIENRTFNIIVRSFTDNDSAPVILERFSKLSLDENSGDFIGKKIGTADGLYEVRSKYFVVELNDNDDISNEIPCGFMGYPFFDSTLNTMEIPFKTKYEITENKRKVYLGFNSDNIDADILKYKGVAGTKLTNGFHLESEGNVAVNVDNTQIKLVAPEGNIDFETEEGLIGTDFEKMSARKFVVLAHGGFNGWDIYRTYRTNETNFSVNKFLGANDYDTTKLKNGGFKKYTTTSGVKAVTSDYYAFLEGVLTYANPKETDINIIATPGIDYDRNGGLVNEIIDIIEFDRKDSVYVINAPNSSSANEAVYALEDSGIDTNYAVTYYPWKQYADPENNVYVNMSVTGDVLRNLAVVDKKSQPWFAVSGLNRGNVKCVKAVKKLKIDDVETLYNGRINPVETIINQGVKVWGNKTLQTVDSALSQFSIRRLLLQARKLVTSASLKLIFDPNDATTRGQFLNLVNPILEDIRKERGLTAFLVEVDESVESIERQELNARILIKPTPTLEYITIEFGITPQGVSFNDI